MMSTRVTRWLVGGLMIWGLFGCDYFAQKELKPGVSTVSDVHRLMGVPERIWDETDGSRTYEYVRGPAGHETYMVVVGADGLFRSMRNVLVPETFSQVKPGMSEDQVRRLLGKPTETVFFRLKQENVWSWRHYGDQQRPMMFNVHFDQDHTVKSTSLSPDPLRVNG